MLQRPIETATLSGHTADLWNEDTQPQSGHLDDSR
jgi:hypothetical protein